MISWHGPDNSVSNLLTAICNRIMTIYQNSLHRNDLHALSSWLGIFSRNHRRSNSLQFIFFDFLCTSFWIILIASLHSLNSNCIVYPINYKPEMLKLFQFDPIQVQLANRCLVFCQRWMNIEIHSRISSIVCREWMKEITQSDIIYALIYSTFCGKRLQWLNLNKLNEGLKTNPSVGLSDRCNDFLFGLDFRRDFMMHALCLAYALDG